MIETTKEMDLYADQFERLRHRAGGGALAATRRAAFERFSELGFPTLRDEAWRFTNVAPIARTPFAPASRDGAAVRAADLPATAGWPRLVFVNGRYEPGLSSRDGLPETVTAASLADTLADDPGAVEPHLARYAGWDDEVFTALNTAFLADGGYIRVPRGAVCERPIEVVFVSTAQAEPTVSYPRNLVVIEPEALATVIERYVGLGDGVNFTNAVTEIVAGDNATVYHVRVGQESSRAYHVGTVRFQQGRDSTVQSHTATFGGALVRNNLTTVLDGPGGHCTLDGLYVISGRQHVDNHLRVEHAKPHCDSREFFKGILEDRARAVFTGRIVVHKDAQKTDAKQTNKNLLLSGESQVDTKPQLEIFADDVKCTHGATIGQIEDDAIFYLRSRGIDETSARGVLVYAFADEVLERVRPESLRRELQDEVLARLPQGELLREAL